MPKFIETIFIGIATFILAVFLPKHLVTFIREIIKFIITSLLKYWYVSLLITGLVFFINIKTDFTYLGPFTSYKFILSVFLAVSTLVTAIAVWREFHKKYKPINIACFGCFNVKDNEYLTIDIDSENQNERIERLIETISATFFTYRAGLIKINNIIIPKIIPIFLGPKGLNKFIKKRVALKYHLATLHFIRDINRQNVSVILNYDKDNLTNANPILNAERLIQSLSTDSNLNSSTTIDISVKIYLLLFGQSLIDLIIDSKELKNAHYILDDTEKLIADIRNSTSNLSPTHKNLADDFLNFWMSYIERYKAILLIEQKQFTGAIRHIVTSIKLNPYFPYDNYITLKQDFTKKYGIGLASTITEANKILETNSDEKTNSDVKMELMKQVQYGETPFNYEIIKSILQHDDSKESGDLLIIELDKLDKGNPFILLTKSEVFKYIKKGTQKFNEIYVERFDESIKLLKETLKLDSEFPLVNTKLGIMMMMKGMHFDNQQLIKEGANEYKKGMHYMIELGFKL